jgi:chemotaxis protein MotB
MADEKKASGIERKIALDKSLSDLMGTNKEEAPPQPDIDEDVEIEGDTLAYEYAMLPNKTLSSRFDDDEDEEEEEASLWLVTFTDAMALMLTFFVLLYSMSEPTVEDWKEINDGINRYFGKEQSPEWYEGPQDNIDIQKLDFSKALNLNYLGSIIADVVDKHDDLKNVTLFPQGQNLIISLPQELLFAQGRADVSSKGKQALFRIGGSLANIRNRIEVIGHTDPAPVSASNAAISSNWELSLRRAMAVADILENVGYERNIITRGLSSARYDELPEEWAEERKYDISRRVDILIMKDDGNRRDVVDLQLKK